MEKNNLATQLRARQYRLKKASIKLINSLSDDQIIDCYITCSCCGEKQVNETQLKEAIKNAADVEHFLDICNLYSKLKLHAN